LDSAKWPYSALAKGRFYLFFMEFIDFFVAVLWRGITICSSRGPMQKLDHLPVRTIFPPVAVDNRSAQTNRRLVVLVTNSEMDAPSVARRILEIADAFRCPILFLGLCSDKSQESSLRRQLVTLSAMVRDEAISFEIRIEIGRDWLNLVKANWVVGDIFVCFARQKAGLSGSMHRALLDSNFESTVYVLDDVFPFEKSRAAWVSSALAWAGSIFIILAFILLQVKINPSPDHLAGMLALMVSIPIEIWLILLWNSLFETR
jgi:hypothetical protein